MPEIQPLRPEQIHEARRVIYATAHHLFHDEDTLEKTIARYQETWPLRDIDDYQNVYCNHGGVFLVAMDGGRIIGTGALRRLDDQTGEIKRLWVLPEYQGRGFGYQLMSALLEAARQAAYSRLRLETSPQYQPRAVAFYRRLGFYEIPRYGDDPDDIGMEMILSNAGGVSSDV
jgi:ribosomal protein S18 acetylase RimI-like enzyme